MIKFLDILKESDDNIFIPRRTKEEKDKKFLFRTYRILFNYIKNGSQGNLHLMDSSIEFLPKNLTQVNGDLMLIECENLKSLPNNLTVNGDVVLYGTKNLKGLPGGLKVKGSLHLLNISITELPQDLEVGSTINLSGSLIKKLPENLIVNGKLNLEDCKKIRSLPNGLKVRGTLDLRDTNITKLPPDLEVEEALVLYRTPLSNLSINKIREMVPKLRASIYS